MTGSMAGFHAYAISGGSQGPSRQLSSIFAKGLTEVFSVAFTARLHGRGSVALTISDQGAVYAGFSITVSKIL